jgi:hypothetical protein
MSGKTAEEFGGERGIRSLGHPLDSVSYTNHNARNAGNGSVAVGPCSFLPPEPADGARLDGSLDGKVALKTVQAAIAADWRRHVRVHRHHNQVSAYTTIMPLSIPPLQAVRR